MARSMPNERARSMFEIDVGANPTRLGEIRTAASAITPVPRRHCAPLRGVRSVANGISCCHTSAPAPS